MTRRIDVLRSWMRSAAKASAEKFGKLPPVANVRATFEEIKHRRASLGEGAVSAALARARGVVASTASMRGGILRIDLTYDDGQSRVFGVMPEETRFAPRGAKEVIFSIEPPELANDPRVRDAVGCVAAAIARALWGPLLGPRREDEQALIDRDGARLRADLRSIPAVRSMLEGGSLAMAFDVVSIEAFEIVDRKLRFKIGLPFPMP